WGSPVLSARDHFARDHSDGGRRATSFLIGPLRPSERATARYRLTAERRGVFEVGPLELELRDPFGLAERRVIAAARNRLVVFPRVEPVLLGSGQGDDDLRVDPPGASLLGRHGDELYSLRPYAVGDDLRRVHWPSTAHRDELMIRQDHRPGQGGLTVLLDLRRQVHTGASAERAISVAASVAVAASRAGQSLRLVTTEGRTNGGPSGNGEHHREHHPAQLPQLLERLAAAGASSSGLAEAVALVAASRPGRRQLVAITASDAAPGDLQALHRLGRQFGEAVVVLVETARAGTAGAGTAGAGTGRGMGRADVAGAPGRRPAAPGGFPGVRVVTVAAGQPLAIAWAAVTGLTSTPGRAARRRGAAPAGRL
ncbi:MAG: DUF58 domain-containing protein, partial [Acidimicrobiales bacterium]|nr:DUF58 domain-containing protein [Acidimicrobiales bacterium]